MASHVDTADPAATETAPASAQIKQSHHFICNDNKCKYQVLLHAAVKHSTLKEAFNTSKKKRQRLGSRGKKVIKKTSLFFSKFSKVRELDFWSLSAYYKPQ
ncbi:hypothetical protein CHARACLAT_005961 [Characodon lateralis]|uniref:Uncharacterized protein n=1 Tax=Characodon lateralis TaxID=208331 RepID=A0ABU7CN71_9TELE|nr:hypothetical protein [Characodon lateralis]